MAMLLPALSAANTIRRAGMLRVNRRWVYAVKESWRAAGKAQDGSVRLARR